MCNESYNPAIILPATNFREKLDLISMLGMISSSLTLVTTSAIVIFIFYKGTFSLPKIKPILHLSIADFLLSFVWFSANLVYLTNRDRNISTVECLVWQLLGEVFHLITFGFTVNYSINVYIQMHNASYKLYMGYDDSVDRVGKGFVCTERFKKSLYFIFWLLPPIIMLPIILNVKGHVCEDEKCVILIDVPRLVNIQEFCRVYGLIVLAVCLSLSIVTILVLYIFTIKLYWQTIPGYHTDRQRKQLRNIQKRITLYAAVFIICWTPAFVVCCLKTKEMLHNIVTDVIKLYPLYIMQAILTPLQGFLNTIVYGWTRKSFRTASRPMANLSTWDTYTEISATEAPLEIDYGSISTPTNTNTGFDFYDTYRPDTPYSSGVSGTSGSPS